MLNKYLDFINAREGYCRVNEFNEFFDPLDLDVLAGLIDEGLLVLDSDEGAFVYPIRCRIPTTPKSVAITKASPLFTPLAWVSLALADEDERRASLRYLFVETKGDFGEYRQFVAADGPTLHRYRVKTAEPSTQEIADGLYLVTSAKDALTLYPCADPAITYPDYTRCMPTPALDPKDPRFYYDEKLFRNYRPIEGKGDKLLSSRQSRCLADMLRMRDGLEPKPFTVDLTFALKRFLACPAVKAKIHKCYEHDGPFVLIAETNDYYALCMPLIYGDDADD